MSAKKDTDYRGGSRGMSHNTDDLRFRNELRRERDTDNPPARDPDDRHRQRQRTCPHCRRLLADCECGS